MTSQDTGVALTIRFPLVLDPADRIADGIAVRGYAIDTGEMLVRPSSSDERGEHGIPKDIWESLLKAQGNPDRACPVCDPSHPGGAELDVELCHRECLLLNVLGPHFVNIGLDKDKPVRAQALRLWGLVEKYGLMRAITEAYDKSEHESADVEEQLDSDDANVVEHSEAETSTA